MLIREYVGVHIMKQKLNYVTICDIALSDMSQRLINALCAHYLRTLIH